MKNNKQSDAEVLIEFVRITNPLTDVVESGNSLIASWRAENVDELAELATVRDAEVDHVEFNRHDRELIVESDAGVFALAVDELDAASVLRAYMHSLVGSNGSTSHATFTVKRLVDCRAVIAFSGGGVVVEFAADPVGTYLY